MSKTIKKFRYDDDGQEEGTIERYRTRRSMKKLKYDKTIGSLDRTDEDDPNMRYETVK